MAYADATRVDANTLRMTDTGSVQTNVRAATKTYGEALEGYIDTYGAAQSWNAAAILRQKQACRDMLVDVLRMLDSGLNK